MSELKVSEVSVEEAPSRVDSPAEVAAEKLVDDSPTNLEYFMIHYRFILVILFLMPMSLCYECWLLVRNWFQFVTRPKTPELHGERVSAVVKQIKAWEAAGRKNKMCTARPDYQTMSPFYHSYKKTSTQIDLNALHQILELDTDGRKVRVEPLVTMGQLTRLLLPLGWTLPVLPELDDLTVGGLVAGCGVETSSHVHGLFQHTCLAFEIVLADGTVKNVSASSTSAADRALFHSIPWSYGTLGFLLSVDIAIVPAKPYADVLYIPYTSKAAALKRFDEESRSGRYDFVEALAYSEETYVLMLADMSDGSAADNKAIADKATAGEQQCELQMAAHGVQGDIESALGATTGVAPVAPPLVVPDPVMNSIGLWYKEWFFMHAKHYLQSNTVGRELMPLRHYYHRHTRSLFWEAQDIVPFGNHPLFRALFGWMMPPKIALLKLTQTEAITKLYELRHVVQDFLVPMRDLGECMEKCDREMGVYPVWLCPFKVPANGLLNRAAPSVSDAEPPGLEESAEGAALSVNRHIGFVAPLPDGDEFFVDVGVYGNPNPNPSSIQMATTSVGSQPEADSLTTPRVPSKGSAFRAAETVRRCESFLRDKRGYEMLYGDCYMTRGEFREMFDHSVYDELRKGGILPQCTSIAFPEVFDKVCKASKSSH